MEIAAAAPIVVAQTVAVVVEAVVGTPLDGPVKPEIHPENTGTMPLQSANDWSILVAAFQLPYQHHFNEYLTASWF